MVFTGVVTSPNHPANYPDSLERTQTLQVEEGLILSLQFIAFNIERESIYHSDMEYKSACLYDHLTITDGDGTTLMGKSCGSTSDGNIVIEGESIFKSIGSSLPANVTSRSNMVNLIFSTNVYNAKSGWNVSWTAVTPGKPHNISLMVGWYFLSS